MRRIVFLCFIVVAVLAGKSAGYGNFKKYNRDNGMSNSMVGSILQDSRGFIWIGTKNGLNRFDGLNFVKFYRDEAPGSLRNSMICALREVSDGKIWVGTDRGISIYDPVENRFSDFDKTSDVFPKNFDSTVTQIVEDDNGHVWIQAHPNVVMYDMKADTLISSRKILNHGSNQIITAIGKGADGNMYFGFMDGTIVSYNGSAGQPVEIARVESVPSCIGVGVHGEVLIGTTTKGVYSIEWPTQKLKRMELESDENKVIYVRTLTNVGSKELWVGTENGVYVVSSQGVTHLTHQPFNENTISDNAIYSIVCDREGGVWIGSYFGGVDYMPPSEQFIKAHRPTAFVNSPAGSRIREFASCGNTLWIASEDNGLISYDMESGRFDNISAKSSPVRIGYNNVQALKMIGDELWIGMFSSGIDVMNIRNGQVRSYRHSSRRGSLGNNDVFSIFQDSGGNIWVGTSSGLEIYDRETDSFKESPLVTATFVSDMLEDHNGNLWIASYNKGVFKYDTKAQQIKHYNYSESDTTSLCFSHIISMTEDSAHRLWFASDDGGFCLFNPENETFRRFTTSNGFPGNTVYKILEGNDRLLWLATNSGLVSFDTDKMAVKAIHSIDKWLPTGQFNFNSGLATGDGRLFFGCLEGFIEVNPGVMAEKERSYEVVPTALMVNGMQVTGNIDGIVAGSISYADGITLPPGNRSFSVAFSALDYEAYKNSDCRYAYRLCGYDDEWTVSPVPQTPTWASLPSGKYRLEMKYSPDGKTWPEKASVMQVSIMPTFSETMLAKFLIFIAVALVIWGVWKFIEMRRSARLEIEEERREQARTKEIYKANLDFFTSVAHEVRTPLTLIKAPLSELLSRKIDDADVKANLETMDRNAERLLTLVNQLLDFRKVEAEAFSVDLKRISVTQLVRATFSRFLPAARQRNIRFAFEAPDDDIMAMADSEALTKVISNLLNNALKFTSTYVVVRMMIDGDCFKVEVHNDGEPIAADQRQNIFKPYYQLKSNNVSNGGFGIGLPLAASLIELHNGTLYLDDEASDTTFVVSVPLNTPQDGSISDGEESAPSEVKDKNVDEASDSAGEKSTVLVVDDNREIIDFVKSRLANHYNVLTASNGDEAIALLNNNYVDVVVSDVLMPVMDGMQLCGKIKSDPELCHIPVVLLTACTNIGSKIEGLQSGADAYIEKPFSFPLLLAQIKNLVESRQALRNNYTKNLSAEVGTVAHTKSDTRFLETLSKLILENIENPDFNIDSLALQMNMSRSSLHRKIKGLMSMTPNDFVKVIRLRRAAELIKEGQYRINEIASLVGYNSISYFSRSFHRQFGVLPKDFGKKTSENESTDQN